MLSQVQKQVDSMKSRMVGRIEWRLERASTLRGCFPMGQPVCSMMFTAAGIEGLQLIFYPSGYNGASEGFCSLFLFCPAGVSITCVLWAGKQRRDITHTFEKPGAFGRTNLCRYEACLDEETDTVLLALDIQEAQQDLHAVLTHPQVVMGDTRNKDILEPRLPKRATESVVKLKRSMKGNLDDVRELPSLWTPKMQGDVIEPSQNSGFKSFQELRGRNKNPLSPLQSSSLKNSASLPAFGKSTERSGHERTVSLQDQSLEDVSAHLPPVQSSGRGPRRNRGQVS